MSDAYAEIRSHIEHRIQDAIRRAGHADKVVCATITAERKPDVVCTVGTRYIVIVDCINTPPPTDFIDFCRKNQIKIWCMDSVESQELIESMGLDADSDVCPLLYDVVTDAVVQIGQTFDSVKWGVVNG